MNLPSLINQKTVLDFLKEENNPLVIYGAGNCAKSIVSALSLSGKKREIKICVDDVYFKKGMKVNDIDVEPISDVLNLCNGIVLVTAFGTMHPNWEQLRCNIKIKKIFGNVGMAYSMPMDSDFIQKYKSEINNAYQCLADLRSQQAFKDYLNSRLFGHTVDLPTNWLREKKIFENVVPIRKDETYCDCGAYNGDTIELFLNMHDSYKKIYAWEPSQENIKQLMKLASTNNIDKLTIINKCASDCAGLLPFIDSQNEVSNVNEKGNKLIEANTIDSLCNDSTIIKIDVEGFELNVIQGAYKTIRSNKPRIYIAAYHRREDFFALLLKLHEYRPDYKFYFRWHRNVPDDVMIYAV